MAKCYWLVSRREMVGRDNLSLECMRQLDHVGPHLVKQPDGPYVAWQKDLCAPGKCLDCDSEDPQDDCLCYGKVASVLELQKYLGDPTFTGEET